MSQDKIRPYEADGIKEYDNPLPRWWLGLMYGTIIFGAIYWVRYHIMDTPTLLQEMEMAASQSQPPAQSTGETMDTGSESVPTESEATAAATGGDAGGTANLAAALSNPDNIAAGAALYQTNCLPCHGAKGEGTIGPNLTDEYFLHGGSNEDIVKVIATGVTEKGMLAWEPILGRKKVEQLTAFVVSITGTNTPGGKAPQGERFQRAP